MQEENDQSWIADFLVRIKDVRELKLDYIPLWITDFLADDNVQVMNTEHKGAYLLLLMRGWQQSPPASIPDDDLMLAGWSGVPQARWRRMRAIVLKPFTRGPDGRLYQKRLSREWEDAVAIKLSRRQGAEKTNALRRAERDAERDAERTHNPTPPNQTQPNPTPPNPTPQRGAERGEEGGGIALGGRGKTGSGQTGGNLGEDLRIVTVQGLLSQAGVNPETTRKLMQRKDVTPARINEEMADIRGDPGVSNVASVLVSRLNRRGR